MPRWYRLVAFAYFALGCLGSASLAADVVFQYDGTIIIGSLVDASGSNLIYDSFGRTRTIESTSVVETQKDLASLKGKIYDIVLTDGSIFSGSISEYDPDIGLFIDLSIGTLTLPATGVASIVDPAQRHRWVGSDIAVRAMGSYYWPVGDGDFGPSVAAGISFDARLPIRGLTIGVDAEWSPLKYLASSEVRYTLFSAVARVGYRYLGWSSGRSALSILSPFASLGAGAAYIGISDSRPGAKSSSSGGVAPRLSAEVGVDVMLTHNLSVRASFKPDLVLQAGNPFTTLGVCLSAALEIGK